MKNGTGTKDAKVSNGNGNASDHEVDISQQRAWTAKRDEIKELFCSTADELVLRHKIGVLVVDLKNGEAKYGTKAVERLAEDLAYDKSTLYEYATVAETWSHEELCEVAGRRNANGLPITFSHLVELTSEGSDKRRSKLLDQVFKQSWSVRELRAEIGKRVAGKRARANATKLRTLAALANEVESVSAMLNHWTTSLAEMCNAASATEISGTRSRLAMQRAQLDKMIAMLDAAAGRLEQPAAEHTNGHASA